MSGNGAAGASYGDLLVTSLIVLGAVCVAAFVAVRLVGRFLATAKARGADVMSVVARLPLEPRRSLYVVEVAGRTLLVGTSEMGLSLVSELDGAAVHARAVATPSFGELVGAAWQRRRAWKSSRGDGAQAAENASHIVEATPSHVVEATPSHVVEAMPSHAVEATPSHAIEATPSRAVGVMTARIPDDSSINDGATNAMKSSGGGARVDESR